MNNMLTIKENWEELEKRLPKDAGKVQRREMRMAFYAGASTMLGINYAIGDKSMPEDEGMKILNGIDKEIKDFGISFLKGEV